MEVTETGLYGEFQIGDKVKVNLNAVERLGNGNPQGSWGELLQNKTSIGTVVDFNNSNNTPWIIIDFPEQKSWKTTYRYLDLVERYKVQDNENIFNKIDRLIKEKENGSRI